MVIKYEELLKILEAHGWISTKRGKGSHQVYVKPETGEITTVPRQKEFKKGVLAAIRRQTGIKEIR